jgi:DHA1 family inner membrane transport protein
VTDPRAARGPAPVVLQLALLSFGTFIVGTNGFIIAGLLPDIAASLETTPSGVGISITVYAAVVAVLAPTFATLLARVPRTRLMAAGLLVTAVGTAMTALAGDLTGFILGRAVAGIGGAAIVPTAVAAAAVMVPVSRRGWAIAIVMLGFTFSTALGSPLGTAIAHVGGWQLPLAGVAVLGGLAALLVALVVRGVPVGPPLSFARRFSVLAEPRILFALLSTVFTIAGFNIAYIFSSTFTVDATGGSGALLALLLLGYGVGGIVGNQVAGRLTDRYGNRIVARILMVTHVVILLVMPLAEPSFAALAVVFLVWGFAAFGTGIPAQHRLASVDPDRASVAVSWYSTAVYVGIAIAPLIGGFALEAVGPSQVPHAAAISVLVAAVLFQIGYLTRRAPDDPRAREAA